MKSMVVNFVEKTINLSNSFAQKASEVGTAEYTQLMEVKEKFPDYSIHVKPKQTRRSNNKYGSLTYVNMEEYIKKINDVERRDTLMLEFNNRKSEGVYPRVRSWFIHIVLGEDNDNSRNDSESLAA